MSENLQKFCADLDWCIEHRRPHALLLPWIDDSPVASMAAAGSELVARGWAYNEAEKQYERDGWFVWFRSQGKLGSPIAQFDKLGGWGDEVDGWGLDHTEFIDSSTACPDCGDYTEGGLCAGCRSNEAVRTQLNLF